MSENRIRIGKQTELSQNPGSIVITDDNNEQNYQDGVAFVQSNEFSTFRKITDGQKSDDINDPIYRNESVSIGDQTDGAMLSVRNNELQHILKLIYDTSNDGQNNVPIILIDDGSNGERIRIHSDHAGNLFFGRFTGKNNTATGPTTGVNNTFFGQDAGKLNTTGYANYFSGFGSGTNNISGSTNTGAGYQSLHWLNEGNSNSALGVDAGFNAHNSNHNIWLGYHCGKLDGDGSQKWVGDFNTLVGSDTGLNWVDGFDNTIVGYQAGFRLGEGYQNLITGSGSARELTDGIQNVVQGFEAAYFIGSGSYNDISGYRAAYRNTSNYNTASGHTAMFNNVNGQDNLFSAFEAGFSSTGSRNVGLGYRAGANAGDGNVMIGYRAGDGQAVSNRLFIDNTNTANPLIGGDFSLNSVEIGGSIGFSIQYPISGAGVQNKRLFEGTDNKLYWKNNSGIATLVA